MAAPSKPVPQKDTSRATIPAATPIDGRAERLAAALRENLKRRKAQARSKSEHRIAEHRIAERQIAEPQSAERQMADRQRTDRQMAEGKTAAREPVDADRTDG